MRLLLRNLLDNALRHGGHDAGTPPPRVTLRARRRRPCCCRCATTVPASTPEQLAHLAEPFYRTDSARQRATGGVGLGLTLCRLVAQAHGGRLTLRNAQPGLQVDVLLN